MINVGDGGWSGGGCLDGAVLCFNIKQNVGWIVRLMWNKVKCKDGNGLGDGDIVI